MLAIGCLIPFATLVIGAVTGSFWGGARGGDWGAGIGLALGGLVAVAGVAALGRIRRRG